MEQAYIYTNAYDLSSFLFILFFPIHSFCSFIPFLEKFKSFIAITFIPSEYPT